MKILDGKEMRGRRIRFLHFPKAADFESCQVLFCAPADLVRFSKANPGLLNRRHVLTVGDKAGFTEAGGGLFLFVEAHHTAFNVNLRATRRAGIEISSNLLKLATTIIEN